jgi:integrase
LDLEVAADLWLWKESTGYRNLDDWVFASPRSKGQYPYRPDTVLAKHIRPAAIRAKIKKHIGWHTFRRTYSTLLIDNGENVKVTQELMRHATTRCTLDVYSQARMDTKREAQQRIVKMIFLIPMDRFSLLSVRLTKQRLVQVRSRLIPLVSFSLSLALLLIPYQSFPLIL